jgi:uncharacterized BrkB/YihY/UPF0761 family membrane protein
MITDIKNKIIRIEQHIGLKEQYKMKVYFSFAIILFYAGDLITTYIGLHRGGTESNSFLKPFGFFGIVVLKIIYLTITILIINFLNKKKLHTESGIVLGSQMAIGVFTILNNMGFYQI